MVFLMQLDLQTRRSQISTVISQIKLLTIFVVIEIVLKFVDMCSMEMYNVSTCPP